MSNPMQTTSAQISRAIIDAPTTVALFRGVTIDTARRCAWQACLYPHAWTQALGAHAEWHRDMPVGGEPIYLLYLTSGAKCIVEPPLASVRHVGDGWIEIRVVFGAELLDLLRAEGASFEG